MDERRDWLTNKDLAQHYRTTVGTIRHWRLIGYGPKGTKVGTRVLYPQAEVDRFDRELAKRVSTATA
jgi:hypothetical protein